jgi:protein involved in polysaccharide export with SLBB domain
MSKRMRHFGPVIAITIMICGCASSRSHVRQNGDQPATVKVGDQLVIDIVDLDGPQSDDVHFIRVTYDQMIFLPRLGRFRAGGRTISELQEVIHKACADNSDSPHILVIVEHDEGAADRAMPHIIRVGDKLSVAFIDDAMSQFASVTRKCIEPDGTILFPIIGAVPAAGLTERQLEKRIYEEFSKSHANRTFQVAYVGRCNPHIIQPGDKLRLSSTDMIGPLSDSVKELYVADDGTISMPLLARIPAVGLTESALVRRILDAYEQSNVLMCVDISCEYIGRCK